jgi:hypothetical protein
MSQCWQAFLRGFIVLVIGSINGQGIFAATIPVSCSSGSLQTAIDNAAAGDTIQVSGTCNENILIRNEKQRITVDGLGSATINGTNLNSPAVNLRGKGILIQGFTIKGGQDGVIINRGSNAVINNNLIQNTNGSGIIVQDLSFAVITSNNITNNPGDGIVINETATARIGFNADSDPTPSSNTIQGNLGRGITVGNRSSARILGNAINSNGQGGVAILRDSNAEVSGNGINGNGSHGILVSENSVLRLVESPEGGMFIAANNTAAGTLNQGFGVSCQTGSVIEGVIGTVNGTSGVSQLLADCIAGVLDQSPIAQADSASTGTNAQVIFTVTSNDSDPDNDPLVVTTYTQGANGTVSCTTSGICTFTPNNNFSGVDTFSYTISDGRGGFTTANATITVTPPDPSVNAPAIDMSVATTVAKSTEFLYSGTNPVQTGVAPGTIQPVRAAVLRGRVLDRNGNVLPGATITILNHPEFGQTVSRNNGMFDLAVNGGELLTIKYDRAGFLPARRQILTPWQNYAWLPDVVLVPQDTRVTLVNLTTPNFQVARGTVMTDARGTRRATLLFAPGTQASVLLPNGKTQQLNTMHVRATEFSVGANGPKAMPASLPGTVAYTHAVDFSVDEAGAAGGTSVTFSQPVVFYLENFINFPVGGGVPLGGYDATKDTWVPHPNGRVVKVLSVTNGIASLDVTGSDEAASPIELAALGITDAELQEVGQLYSPAQSLWRAPIPHFSYWDT